ncbi:hypothetical protein KI387_001604, partial [Taxus chinensis]
GEGEEDYPGSGHGGYRKSRPRQRFKHITSKQMVVIFISIWVERELCRHIRDMKFCCVGCGLIGFLGNK